MCCYYIDIAAAVVAVTLESAGVLVEVEVVQSVNIKEKEQLLLMIYKHLSKWYMLNINYIHIQLQQ